MYPVIYWCDVYDDDYQTRQISGVTFADNYAEAAKKIESYYGDDLINLKMETLYESSVMEFHTYEEAKKIVSYM